MSIDRATDLHISVEAKSQANSKLQKQESDWASLIGQPITNYQHTSSACKGFPCCDKAEKQQQQQQQT